MLLGRGAWRPDFPWHVEDHALFERRDDFDIEVVAFANGFDDLFDDDLWRRCAGRDADRVRVLKIAPRNILGALDQRRKLATGLCGDFD